MVGVGLVGGACLLGLVALAFEEVPGAINTARLFLVLIGAITAGAAVSMRPDLWWAWALAAAAALLGVGGLPGHWDSYRMVLRVVTGVAVLGSILCCCSKPWRYGVASAAILFHFTGIFMATTSPPTDPYPAPWVTIQAFGRVYQPYLQFIYQRNAYHFYSPNPGPASVLAFLLKTDTGETEVVIDPVSKQPFERKIYKTEWVVMPKRPRDVRDPLGLSYYRRLSLTEQLARGSPGVIVPDQFEKSEVSRRRLSRLTVIPFHPTESVGMQYKLPNPDVARYLLPSYASHVILDNTPDAETAARTQVKIYRLEHRTLRVEQFASKLPGGGYPSPYAPETYLPFFLGEFDVHGNLVNPQEELLYWLIPIEPRTPAPNDPNDPFRKPYLDYLSVHALEISPNEVLKADESKGQVFNWSQLR
jgi:hypothetical protein